MGSAEAKYELSVSIDTLLQQAKSQGVVDRAVVGFIHPDQQQSIQTLHSSIDSLFDVASITKSVPVSTLALRLILLQKLDLHAPVIQWIPELQNAYREEVQVFHLLTHSLDYRFPLSSCKDLPASRILQRIWEHPYGEKPGFSFSYGNAASILLGILLERFTGLPLDQQAQQVFFEPLEMNDTGWFPLQRGVNIERIVPTENCSWRGRVIQGEVHDESAFTLQQLGPVGSAGVFSTVPDLLKFVQMLLSDGMGPSGRLLPLGVLPLLSQNALPWVDGQGTALGWELCNRRFMGERVSSKAFGKTGFTGSCIIADPEKGSALVMLSNFTWPQRESNVERIYQLRRSLADCFFAYP